MVGEDYTTAPVRQMVANKKFALSKHKVTQRDGEKVGIEPGPQFGGKGGKHSTTIRTMRDK